MDTRTCLPAAASSLCVILTGVNTFAVTTAAAFKTKGVCIRTQAAEIIGISCRQMRRWLRRYEEHGYEGLRDRRRGRVSEKRVPLAQVEEVLRLYQEQYFDFNVRHFHEKLQAEHGIKLVTPG